MSSAVSQRMFGRSTALVVAGSSHANRASDRRKRMRLVVFRKAFGVAQILHRREDRLHLGKKFLIDGLADPIGPLADVVGIRGAGDRGGDVGIGAGELDGELRE